MHPAVPKFFYDPMYTTPSFSQGTSVVPMFELISTATGISRGKSCQGNLLRSISKPLTVSFEQRLKNTQTRTLTTSVEAIVGSAGDDTITAPATVAATGVAQTTINSGDSIDGGTGTDTLTLTLSADAASNNSLSGLTIKGVENITYVGVNNLATGNADAAAAATAAAVELSICELQLLRRRC